MCLPDKLQHGSSILPARVCAQTKHPELARRLDITPHEGHVIGGVKQPYKPAALRPAGTKVAEQTWRSNGEVASPSFSDIQVVSAGLDVRTVRFKG